MDLGVKEQMKYQIFRFSIKIWKYQNSSGLRKYVLCFHYLNVIKDNQ